MANTVQVSAQAVINDGLGSKQISQSVTLTPAGTKYICEIQSIGTATEALAIGDCSTLGYVMLAAPSTNTATVTATVAAIVLAPGQVALFKPSTSNVTLQATAAAVDLGTFTSEQ